MLAQRILFKLELYTELPTFLGRQLTITKWPDCPDLFICFQINDKGRCLFDDIMIVPGVDGDIIPVLPDIIYRVRRESPTKQDLELPPLSSDGPHPLISGELVEYMVSGPVPLHQVLTLLLGLGLRLDINKNKAIKNSDSLFSLIIFIYVAVTFLYVFYAFCWRQPPRIELTEIEKKVRNQEARH